MRNRASVLVLWVVCAGVATLAMVQFEEGPGRIVRGASFCNPLPGSEAILPPGRPNHPYGKIELPARLSVSLEQGAGARDSLMIRVAASSLVPVDSAVLTLMVPEVGAEPNRTEVLWAGTPADFVTETVAYEVRMLPVGRYCFTVAFEFTPQGADADRMATSQSLYLDVTPAGILSSNVSFEQIKRLELRRELEHRILEGHKPGLAIASEEATAAELARLEAADPGFLDRKIAEIKATDPDVARRILELNEHQASVEDGNGAR